MNQRHLSNQRCCGEGLDIHIIYVYSFYSVVVQLPFHTVGATSSALTAPAAPAAAGVAGCEV